MLNIRSKLRKDILALYFSHTERKYYLRELERILERPVGYIRREMIALENSGLFVSEEMGKQKYFYLNKNYPLFEETKKIVSKTFGIEHSIIDELKNIPSIQVAFIFGSFAKNEEDATSDIDLMIIGKLDEDALIDRIDRLETKLNREINYHLYSVSDFRHKLLKKDHFLARIVQTQKIFLIGSEDEFRKVTKRA